VIAPSADVGAVARRPLVDGKQCQALADQWPGEGVEARAIDPVHALQDVERLGQVDGAHRRAPAPQDRLDLVGGRLVAQQCDERERVE
jgi:hypothetical protein